MKNPYKNQNEEAYKFMYSWSFAVNFNETLFCPLFFKQTFRQDLEDDDLSFRIYWSNA